MKKTLLTLSIALCSITLLFAQHIPQENALHIAQQFVGTPAATSTVQKAPQNNTLQLVHKSLDKQEKALFYIYNIGENNGFVIVSADQRTKKILAYAKNGHFSTQHLPTNLSYWLQSYEQEIEYAIKHLPTVGSNASIKPMRMNQMVSEVQPLLGAIAYDQAAPYNNLSPKVGTERTVTGCVATAIAQVMRYHQHPAQGSGSKSYTSRTHKFNLTADFSSSTYDWTKIKPSYNDSEPADEKAAIAQLMYDIGVSVEMNYDLSSAGGSGAVTSKAVNGLFTYFGYDAGIQNYHRKYYTADTWEQKIKNELNDGRPVIYSGSNTNAGHAFVCDGYDNGNKFHINWGWGGYSNGYFELSALNPGGGGIGSSNGGYNMHQEAIMGIQKPIANSTHTTIMGMDGLDNIPTQIGRNETFNITATELWNIGRFTYTGVELRLTLLQGTSVIQDVKTINLASLDMNHGWDTFNYLNNISIPSTVPNGNYQLILRYKDHTGSFVPVLVAQTGISKVDVEVTDANITFSATAPTPNLQLTAPTVAKNTLYQNRKGEFEIKLSNSGTAPYNAQIGIKLVKTDDNTITQELFTSLTHLPIGTAEKQFSFIENITVAPGTYFVEVYYDSQNNSGTSTFPTTLLTPLAHNRTEVTVLPTPPAPSLSQSVTLPIEIEKGKNFTLPVNMTNSGGAFFDYIEVYLFPKTLDRSIGGALTSPLVNIEQGETKVVNFDLLIDNVALDDYYLGIRANNNWIGSSIPITLIAPTSTNIDNHTEEAITSSLYRQGDKLIIQTPTPITQVILFDLNGRERHTQSVTAATPQIAIPISHLPKGVYLVQIIGKNREATMIEKVIL